MDSDYSSISQEEANGFSTKILRTLLNILTSDEKLSLSDFLNKIRYEIEEDWSIHHVLELRNEEEKSLLEIPIGKIGWYLEDVNVGDTVEKALNLK